MTRFVRRAGMKEGRGPDWAEVCAVRLRVRLTDAGLSGVELMRDNGCTLLFHGLR
jgi:hypothetical protein